MKKIEVLYKEFQHLYADLWNPMYLDKCSNDIEIIYTPFGSKPYFMDNKVDMIYIGSVADNKIPIIINELEKYKDKIRDLIDNNVIFLITGNAIEIFSEKIEENGQNINGLGIFDYNIKKDMNDKHISWFKGKFNDMEIIGHKNQFSRMYQKGLNFIETIDGLSSNYEDTNEGIHYKNFYATYLLGPILIMNPNFTKYILRELGLNDKLLFEEDIYGAFEERMKFLNDPETRFIMGDKG